MKGIKSVHIKHFLIGLMLLAVFLSSFSSLFKTVSAYPSRFDYVSVIKEIDMERIKKHIETFTSFGSRFTGYPGCELAAKYIHDEFIKLGLTNVSYEYFNVAVPYDYGANITVLKTGEVIPAYPLLPNSVETCAISPEGIEGQLIYVKDGDLENYKEKIKGNIILMDFDSRDRWLYAAQFGAKAVIFIEKEITQAEASRKIVGVPLDFPRLYVTEEAAQKLLRLLKEGPIYINVKSLMVYKNLKAKNVVGYILGSDEHLKNEIVVIAAYYDSTSIVPSISPGAEEACGIAALLELARYYSYNPPKRTIMFLALAGHHQGLAGAREFTYKHLNELGSKIKIFINLDLSTRSNILGVYYWGLFYAYEKPIGRFLSIKNLLFKRILPEIESQLKKDYNVIDVFIQDPANIASIALEGFMLDSEPFTLAGGVGISFYTSKIFHLFLNTPFDTLEKLNFSNLLPQIEFIFCSLLTFTQDEELTFPETSPVLGNRDLGGWVNVHIQVLEYDYETAWYKPVPNAIIVFVIRHSFAGWYVPIVGIADENGSWTFLGASHKSSPSSAFIGFTYDCLAFVDDPTYGSIEYAPDYGKYGAIFQTTGLSFDTAEEFLNVVVFKCGTIALIGSLDPNRPGSNIQLTSEIRVIKTEETPEHFSYLSWPHVTMAFGPLDKKIEVILRSIEPEPIGILSNASIGEPAGAGLQLEPGKTIIVNPINVTWDLYWLNEVRLSAARGKIITGNVEAVHNKSYLHLNAAIKALESNNYEDAFKESLIAWSYSANAYLEIKYLVKDTETSMIYFFMLLLPFVLMLEKLLFETAKLTQRILRLAGLFLLFASFLYFIHPAFVIAQNLYMTVIGFVLFTLIFPSFLFIFSELVKLAKKAKISIKGEHEIDVSKASIIISALNIGIQNLKRRKMRFSLNVLTLVLIVTALVSFTSVTRITLMRPREYTTTTAYDGFFTRSIDFSGTVPINEMLVTFLKAYFDKPLAARSFIYPWAGGKISIFTSDGSEIPVRAILGLSPLEGELSGVKSALIRGSWFPSSALYACIIPEEISRNKGIQLGDVVIYGGMNLTVIGIYSSKRYDEIVDYDGFPISPIISAAGSGPMNAAPSNEIIIIPYDLARNLGSDTFSIAIKMDDPSVIFELAKHLGDEFSGLHILAGVNGTVKGFDKRSVETISGWHMITIPFIVASLTILDTMLGAVYQRRKEIGIYASLGLSPLYASVIFISETVCIALLGGIFGFILANILNKALVALRLLPTVVLPNTSSSVVAYSVLITMASAILSSIYPAYVSAALVTPSLERKWKIHSKPRGDLWDIPLPIVIEREETDLLLSYMKEYLENFRTERDGAFYFEDPRLYEEREGKSVRKILEAITRLAPYEAGIEQKTKLILTMKEKEQLATTSILITRISGVKRQWESSNRRLIDQIRKQLLLWKSLSYSKKIKYRKDAKN